MSDTTAIRVGLVLAIPVSFVIMTAGALSQRITVFAFGIAVFALAFALLFLTEARHALDRRHEP